MKTCINKKCEQKNPQSFEQFCKNKNNIDGLADRCRNCYKEYRIQNKENIANYHKRWFNKKKRNASYKQRVSKKEFKQARKGYYLKRNYDITIEYYNELFNNQDGKCAICKIEQKDLKKSLCVDHDHKTGIVRALLCVNCNSGLGYFKENEELCKQAFKYLESFKKD